MQRWVKYQRLTAMRKLKWFRRKHYSHWMLVLILGAFLAIDGCSRVAKIKDKAKVATVPVLVAAATTQDVPIYVSALGSVTPTDTVTIRTQINGQLLRILFDEGQMVEADALLAEIDPRPYEAQLLQYQGQLARDKALLDNARLDLERYKVLYSQDSTSKQVLDTQAALVKQYEGDVKSDQGQINTARLSLTYCKIIAPIAGRVGLRQVDPGNVVQTADPNGIVVLNATQPITVLFSIGEDYLPAVAQKIATGAILTVDAQDRAQKKLLATGVLQTMDNQIDSSTGTIKLRAIFENKDNILFPNQFVNVQLLVDTISNATVVPTTAVQYGINGTFVYLLNSDLSVSIKPVTVVGATADLTAINSDIKPGDQVVIQGTDNLKDGASVTVLSDDRMLRS